MTAAGKATLTALTGLAIGVGLYEAADNVLNNESDDEGPDSDNGPDSPDGKRNSSEKAALVDMAKQDKRRGITAADVEAYGELNDELPDSFPEEKVRGPEAHNSGLPSSQAPHAHVGPVDHIPVTDVTRDDLGLEDRNDD